MINKKKLVVLTGAGISAESGLRTFRDTGGLWEGYKIEDVATPRAWQKNRAHVQEFYNKRRKEVAKAKPNAAHYGLAELENDFDVTIITQNIDDLHERAGSNNVLHLHGEIFKMRSDRNSKLVYDIHDDIPPDAKAEDGGFLRPHVVWFEESVPLMESAMDYVLQADIFAVIGTSLIVYPAAGLVGFAPATAPVFIVDKEIPFIESDRIIEIKKVATEGIMDLKTQLLAMK